MSKNIIFTILLIFAFSNNTFSQLSYNENDSISQIFLDEVTVIPQTVKDKSSGVATTLNKEQITKNNIGNNIPDILKTLTSAISYNEGGSAVGNTFLSIRGTAPNRLNITLNGMPMSNPESQDMYWVNLPNITSSLRNIQVQRGVGNSVAGTASFGGSINLQTERISELPYVQVNSAIGSYTTLTESVALGTGLIHDKFSFDARYSYIHSNGYIDNGKVNHHNLFASFNYNISNNQLIKLVYIHGIQHTGITWNGASLEELKKYGRRYNPAGLYTNEQGNEVRYKNETDNYYSHIVQTSYTNALSNQTTLNVNVGYNNGYGYYENYKKDRKFSSFGVPNQEVGGVEYKKSDIIRQQKMKNDFYFLSSFLNFRLDNLELTTGANASIYDGHHYGKLLWAKYNQNIPKDFEWYRNSGKKDDGNIFIRATYNATNNLIIDGELQARFIKYTMQGTDDDLGKLNKTLHYNFFNPKAGITYIINDQNYFRTSVAIANREPQRSDLKLSVKDNFPINPERLYDFEMGYNYSSDKFTFDINSYYMLYYNQLVPTGQLSPTGYKYQQNAKNSYRMGVEMETAFRISPSLSAGGNITLSKNKIKNYTAYYDLYNNIYDYEYVGQTSEFFKNTDIALSPNVVGAILVTYQPWVSRDFSITMQTKYVGKRYFDNTSNKDKQLDDYLVSDLNMGYKFNLGERVTLGLRLIINNLMNKKYFGSAGTETVKFETGETRTQNYSWYFPQATRNFMLSAKIDF